MSGKAHRHPPGGHTTPDLLHLLIAVHVDKANRELHPERMDGFTRNNPHTLSRRKTASSQQALSPRCAAVRHLDRGAENGVPRAIKDPKLRIGARLDVANDAVPN